MNEIASNDSFWTSGMLMLAGFAILAIFLGGWWLVKAMNRGNRTFRFRQKHGGDRGTKLSDDPAERRFQCDPWL